MAERRTACLAIFLSATLVLAACDGGEAGETTTSVGDATTTSEEVTTTEAPTTTTEAPTTTRPSTTTTSDEPVEPVGEPTTESVTSDGFPGTTEPAYLTDIRIAAHQGFDRIVFEFTGGPAPEYLIEYVDAPVLESPSGNEIGVAGEAFLSITMSPASGVDLSEEEPVEIYEGPDRIEPEGGSGIVEVVRTEDFENVTTWVVGLRSESAFGVDRLEDPARLVVDIRQ